MQYTYLTKAFTTYKFDFFIIVKMMYFSLFFLKIQKMGGWGSVPLSQIRRIGWVWKYLNTQISDCQMHKPCSMRTRNNKECRLRAVHHLFLKVFLSLVRIFTQYFPIAKLPRGRLSILFFRSRVVSYQQPPLTPKGRISITLPADLCVLSLTGIGISAVFFCLLEMIEFGVIMMSQKFCSFTLFDG